MKGPRPGLGRAIGSLVDSHYRDRANLYRLLDLGQVVQATTALIHELQKERGLSSGFLASEGQRFAAELPAQVQRSEAALRHCTAVWEALLPGFRVPGQLKDLARLRADVRSGTITSASAVQGFSALIDALLVVVAEVPGTSSHPQVTLALLALFNFVLAKEFRGQERALGSAVCAQGHFEPFQHDRFRALTQQREEALAVFARHASIDQLESWDEVKAGQAFRDLEELHHDLDALAPDQPGRVPSAELWFDRATAVIDILREFEKTLLDDLDQLCLQIQGEARSAWENSQEVPEVREALVVRRLERAQARLQAERQTLRLGTTQASPGASPPLDQAADLAANSAALVDQALRWKRNLKRLDASAENLKVLARKARILSLETGIQAMSRAELKAGALALAEALAQAAVDEKECQGILESSTDQVVQAFERLHTQAVTLRLSLLEGDQP